MRAVILPFLPAVEHEDEETPRQHHHAPRNPAKEEGVKDSAQETIEVVSPAYRFIHDESDIAEKE